MDYEQQQTIVDTWNTFIINAFPNHSPWQLNLRRIQNNGMDYRFVTNDANNAQGTLPSGEIVDFGVYVRDGGDHTFHMAIRSNHGFLDRRRGTPVEIAEDINDIFSGRLVNYFCQVG
jgi:hypothetical protein